MAVPSGLAVEGTLAEIAGSNFVLSMDVCLLQVLYVVR
jgi:hypothetical protein